MDAIDLIDFKADLKAFAVATEAEDAPLVPGDHCRFCPAAQLNPKTMEAHCPAVGQRRQEAAKMEFSPVQSYDPEALRKALDSREVMKAWIKQIDEFAYREAEAGRCPPGYKLVAKRPTRKWADEGAVVDLLQNTFDDKEVAEMYEPVALRSVAQLEGHLAAMKAFSPEIKAKGKRKDAAKEFFDPHVSAESSGNTLAPDTDSRAPVDAGPQADFKPVAEDDLQAIPDFLRRNKKAEAPESIFD
jgi:hypothetical protein